MPLEEAPIAALGELLCNHCLGLGRTPDADTAGRILLAVSRNRPDSEILIAATGGVRAAFASEEDPADESGVQAAESARVLLRAELPDSVRLLMAVSLALLAEKGLSDRLARDFVAVTLSAVQVDQDRLALWAAREALSRVAELTVSQEAAVRLAVAVVTQDRDDILKAYDVARKLPTDDPRARQAQTLRSSLHPDEVDSESSISRAVERGDRRTAAAAFAHDWDEVYRDTGDPLIGGVRDTMVELSKAHVDVDAARRGLVQVVGRLRARQRYGQVPAVAQAAADVLADMLIVDATPETADLLGEFVEALADAGLSEAILAAESDEPPLLIQAQLADAALRRPVWPDLRSCVDGLRGRPALILREQQSRATRTPVYLSLYIEPPGSVSIATIRPDAHALDLLQAFARSGLAQMATTTVAEVDELVRNFLPAALIDRSSRGELPSLLVIPDGPLWSLPWQAAGVFRATAVSAAPSMSMYSRLPPFDGVVRSIAAFVSEDLPEAKAILNALAAAQSSGSLIVRRHDEVAAAEPSDLMLVFAHGSGNGLTFRTGAAARSLSALDLAGTLRVRAAVVASCWSAAAPPVSFPMTLPAAMMMNGVSAVVGGLWPLPTGPTAEAIAGLVEALGSGQTLTTALSVARRRVPDGVLQRWGLAAHGVVQPFRT